MAKKKVSTKGRRTSASRARSIKKKGSRKGSSESFLGPEQRREILAYALIALAVLTLLALIPVGAPGSSDVFPSGNAIGALGVRLHALLGGFFGIAAFFVPLLLGLVGATMAGWMERANSVRLGALFAGLLILVPVGVGIGGGAVPAGALGRGLAGPLTAGLGLIGAAVVTGVALLTLSIATLRWNPVEPLGRAVVKGGGVVSQGIVKAKDAVQAAAETGAQRAKETAATVREKAAALTEDAAGLDDDVDPHPHPFEDPDPEPVVVGSPEPVPPRPKRKRKKEPVDPMELPDPRPTGGLQELPPLDLLTAPSESDRRGMEQELEQLGEVLVEKLRSFNVDCTLGGRTTGPVVTQFEVVPAAGVKVNKIATLDADLALAMRAKSIRIVAPIPGKGAVGVEIPNPAPQMVQLREILSARGFQNSRSLLPLGLGQDLTGKPYVSDLAKMPHVLIAGATGAGKSVCLNTIITSLVYRHTPETLRLLLIDPKMVELSAYSDLPHLRHSVVTDPRDAAGVLKWAVLEMERRYELLSANGVRSLAEFNKRVESDTPLRRPKAVGDEGDPDRFLYTDGILPYIVVVVDELADLMMTVQGEVEKPLTQLAQKARAIGIHLIVATQRPSVNVITGLIKANFPTRIAFRVASKTDSRTILDQNGADALLGNGDMLFLPPGQSEAVRIQGAYIATEDTDQVMQWYRDSAERIAAEDEAAERAEDDILEVVRELENDSGSLGLDDGDVERDAKFREAAEVCIAQAQGSTSLLQRKLRVGYGRAARIVDQLHEAGILGPPDGSKPREVLIGMDGLDLLLSGGSSGTGIEADGYDA